MTREEKINGIIRMLQDLERIRMEKGSKQVTKND